MNRRVVLVADPIPRFDADDLYRYAAMADAHDHPVMPVEPLEMIALLAELRRLQKLQEAFVTMLIFLSNQNRGDK